MEFNQSRYKLRKLDVTPTASYDKLCAHIFWTKKEHFVLTCNYCKFEYEKFTDLMEHCVNDHNSLYDVEIDSCDVLEYLKEDKECWAEVIITQNATLVYNCLRCEDRYGDYLDLLDHFKFDHENTKREYNNQENFTITDDSNSQPSDTVVIEESRIDLRRKPPKNKVPFTADLLKQYTVSVDGTLYTCTICQRRFPYLIKVQQHLASHSTQESFKCDICGSILKDKHNFAQHRRRHLEQKKYKCPDCDWRFHTPSEMKRHQRHHVGERLFMCPECGRNFFTSGILSAHLKRHSNTRSHECKMCHKKFFDTRSLNDHMASHKNERSHKCEHCGSSFNRRKTLMSHLKLHMNKREYQCMHCPASFNQRPGLASHIRRKHKEMEDQRENEDEEEIHIEDEDVTNEVRMEYLEFEENSNGPSELDVA